jgi:tetratricopeptide (TPR) repeat protein
MQDMKARPPFLNRVFAALVAIILISGAAAAQTATLDGLFERLKTADPPESDRIEREIENEWSKSGSPAMDLLLQRGREALVAGNIHEAIAHFTALTDHAPDFAEGWNGRATAYYQAGLIGPSIADIGHVLTLNPRHYGALAGLAGIHEQLGNKPLALRVFRAVLAIHPHLTDVSNAIERLEKDVAGTDL